MEIASPRGAMKNLSLRETPNGRPLFKPGAGCAGVSGGDEAIPNEMVVMSSRPAPAAGLRNAGIFQLYRQRTEDFRRGQMPGPPVRLRARRGVSHVQLFSGIHRAVAAGGTVEMTAADAPPLLNAGWVRVEAGDLSGPGAAVS